MIGAIGGAAADIVQAIRDARAERSSGTTKPATTDASASPAAPATTGTGQAAGAPPSDPVAKLLADVKSLLLNVQSGTASGDGTTDAAAAVQDDLKGFASAGTAGGRIGHHHHHPAPVGGAGPDPSATTAAAGAAGQDTGLASAIAKAIGAYRTGSASTAPASATASA